MERDRLAFFDFDGTLTRHDTLFTFARHAVGQRRLVWALLRSLPRIFSWKVGLTSNSSAKEKLFSCLYKGMRYDEFIEAGRTFADEIDKDLNPEGVRLMSKHLKQGDKVCIVSAGMEEWIRKWASRHGVDMVLATCPEVSADGCLTGRFRTPNCHGLNKVERIKMAFPDLGNYETYGYGDSSGDEAMLRLVEHPLLLK